MSVLNTKTPSTQMAIHLSTVAGDFCYIHRTSYSDGNTSVNSCSQCLFQTQKLLLLRWQYTCHPLKGMSVLNTENPYAQMAIHLSTVEGDVCSKHRNSFYSDGNTPVNSYGGCMFQTQKLLLLRWQYICKQLQVMSFPEPETPSTQMAIHLSTVEGDVCYKYRKSFFSDGNTPVNSCRRCLL